jgi:hypothetical protein
MTRVSDPRDLIEQRERSYRPQLPFQPGRGRAMSDDDFLALVSEVGRLNGELTRLRAEIAAEKARCAKIADDDCSLGGIRIAAAIRASNATPPQSQPIGLNIKNGEIQP